MASLVLTYELIGKSRKEYSNDYVLSIYWEAGFLLYVLLDSLRPPRLPALTDDDGDRFPTLIQLEAD
jgi:hypothetical protein